ncbi:unnamed protein product [Calypogeia fissa]
MELKSFPDGCRSWFICCCQWVSRQARELPPSKNGGVLRNTCPLLVLGFSRLLLTKGVDYQEHVAEYGVHWNFFFHSCSSSTLDLFSPYSCLLLWSPGSDTPWRPNLISLNKEGIFSILGYWSIYLISVQLGHYLIVPPERRLHQNDDTSTKTQRKGRRTGTVSSSLAIDVWVLDAFLWFLAILGDVYIERISRRMCNLPYVIFVFAMNLEMCFFPLSKCFFYRSSIIICYLLSYGATF